LQPGDIAALLLAVAGSVITSWLTGKLLPLDKPATETPQLTAKYQTLEMWVGLIWLILLAPAASVVIWRFLVRLGSTHASKLGEALILLVPSGIEWALAAVFPAMTLTVLLMWLCVRIYLGRQYAEYRRYEQIRWGASRIWIWSLFAILAGLSLLFAVALLDTYVLVTNERIRINPFFSRTERSYLYQEVRDIRTAASWIALAGNEVENREYVLCFKDGLSWSTDSHPGVLPDKLRLAQFISEQSGVPITELSVLSRKDQSCESALPPAKAPPRGAAQ